MIEHCRKELLKALKMASGSSEKSTLVITPTYVVGLFYNLSDLGFRLVHRVVLACPALLAHQHLGQEAAVLTEMAESLDAYCQEYNTDGDYGWYAFLRNGKMSYTEFSRRILQFCWASSEDCLRYWFNI